MHRIRIVAVGRDKDAWVRDACNHFEKLLRKYARVEWEVVASARGHNLSPAEAKREEAERLRKRLEGAYTVALADSARDLDSLRFASWLERTLTRHSNRVAFVIGGPYGLDQSLVDGAGDALSLSPLTFSHQLVRPVLLEQLYRAFTILGGGTYHK
jgi:23S rRNA (pseudouridine1915-N3)-methyltransferase